MRTLRSSSTPAAARRASRRRTPTSATRALVLVAVLVVALAGCSASSGDEGTKTGSRTGFIGGNQLTRVAKDKRVAAPVVSGPKLGNSGQTLSTADYAGKVLVINVWGSWCPPCREEAEGLQQASKETAGKAQFIGINNRDADPASAEAFVRAKKITYPSIYDPSGTQLVKFAGSLPPSAIPSTMVIDADGKMAVRILGPISEKTLVDIIDDTAAGK